MKSQFSHGFPLVSTDLTGATPSSRTPTGRVARRDQKYTVRPPPWNQSPGENFGNPSHLFRLGLVSSNHITGPEKKKIFILMKYWFQLGLVSGKKYGKHPDM
jgi:hypothetical protein